MISEESAFAEDFMPEMMKEEITAAGMGGEGKSEYKSLRLRARSVLWMLLCAAFFTLHASLLASCSETDGDEGVDEYADWQMRNDAFFASLEDSLSRGGEQWKKIKTFTKDEKTVGQNTDYIYVKVLESYGSEADESPLYSDSVRIAYRGRLIPSVSYPQGYVFEQTYAGDYSIETTSVADNTVSAYLDGFATALQHMKKGDRWRVFLPYQLMYGGAASGSIPAYSVLIFDISLIDFTIDGGSFYRWT